MSGLTWGDPAMLRWLWVLPVVAVLQWLALRSRRQAMGALGALVERRTSAHVQRVHRLRAVLLFGVLTLSILALARPQWGYRWQELRQEGLSLVVAMDVSRSMDAADVSPSRLERAQREVQDLAGLLSGDRVGLVLFAGGAYAQMPLTLDYVTLSRMARAATSDTLRAQGSDLGAAIDKAVEILGAGEAADRAIILLTDGEDQVGEGPDAAARAAEKGIKLFTIGIGTPDGAPIPMRAGGFKKDPAGKVVISRLEEEALQELAQVGQGAYVRSVAGGADMRAIYLDEIRGKLQVSEQGVRREKIWTERYQWFLGAAFALLVLSGLLRPGPLRLQLAGLLLAAGLLGGRPALASDLDDLIAAQVEDPDDLALAEQLGGALHAAGRYEEAAETFAMVADRSPDDAQRLRARYNAGLARYHAGELTAAVEDWQRVLQRDPEHAAAQQNVAAVQAEIAARLNEPPPQDGEDGEPQDGEPQDGEDGAAPQDGEDGESQDSESQDSESQDSESQDSEPQDGTTGTPPEAGDTGTPEQLQPQDGALGDTGAPDGEPEGLASQAQPGASAGEMSAAAAARLLDSVEEGTPRVQVDPGSRGGNDW